MDAQDRKILEGLDRDVREKAEMLYEMCERRGIRLGFRQGYRTFAQQAALYAQGRTTMGRIVTNAKPGFSWHNWRRAFDVVIEAFPGDTTPNDVYDGPWSIVGDLGEFCGLEWGGRWKHPDIPHFQSPLGTLSALVRAWPTGLEDAA